jgi:hypothetical protein
MTTAPDGKRSKDAEAAWAAIKERFPEYLGVVVVLVSDDGNTATCSNAHPASYIATVMREESERLEKLLGKRARTGGWLRENETGDRECQKVER